LKNAVVGDRTEGVPVAFNARHVEACESCRQFFNRSEELDSLLKRDALRTGQSVSPGLDRRIMQAVRRSSRPEPTVAAPRRYVFPLVGAVAGLILVAFFLARQPPGSSGPDGQRPTGVAGVSPNEFDAARLWRSIAPPAEVLLEKNPLQEEMDLVYSDARSAVRFLALNFLPSTTDPAKLPAHNPSGVED